MRKPFETFHFHFQRSSSNSCECSRGCVCCFNGSAFIAGLIENSNLETIVYFKKKLDQADARHDYKTELKGEIELLKSAATSRRPSFTMSEASKELFLTHANTAGNSRIGSRIGSRRPSSTNLHLSWRNNNIEPPYTPLPNDENV